MTQDIVTEREPMVKVFDRSNPKEVYDVLREFYPDHSAKQFTPDLVTPFIPEGAEPGYWLKMLRNVEYNLSQPKPKRKKSRSAGQAPRGYNPAEAVTRRETTKALFTEVV